MKYEISNLKINTVAQGKPNAGRKYLEFTAVNVAAPLEIPGVVCIFNARTVELFAPYISQANGGTATGPVELPDSFKYINGRFETFVFPTPGTRTYSAQVTTKDGRVHQPGEMVMNGNQPRIYKSAQVFTMRQVDPETGEISYLRGWDCDTRGQQMFSAFYTPVPLEHATMEAPAQVMPQAGNQVPPAPQNPFAGQTQGNQVPPAPQNPYAGQAAGF